MRHLLTVERPSKASEPFVKLLCSWMCVHKGGGRVAVRMVNKEA